MELHWGWPVVTTLLMFASYWVAKVTGFADGYDEGRYIGIEEGSKATAKVVMEYMRDNFDVKITDPEIGHIIESIHITEEFKKVEDYE